MKKILWVLIPGIAAFLVFFCLKICLRTSVEDYTQKMIRTLDKDLEDKNNEFRKKIETAHGCAVVRSARVLTCAVTTLDKSRYVNRQCANIDRIRFKAAFRWSNLFQKNGYTVLYIDYDYQANAVVESKIVFTNAVVNLEDPRFWHEALMLTRPFFL